MHRAYVRAALLLLAVAAVAARAAAVWGCKAGVVHDFISEDSLNLLRPHWWSNFALTPKINASGTNYVPMVAALCDLTEETLAKAPAWLVFDRPNTAGGITADLAASQWALVQQAADNASVPLVGPVLDLGSEGSVDPVDYISSFFEACNETCSPVAVGLVVSACSASGLVDVVDALAAAAGVPVWVVFQCADENATAWDEYALLYHAAVALDADEHVARWAWLGAIGNDVAATDLLADDGESLTDLGGAFVNVRPVGVCSAFEGQECSYYYDPFACAKSALGCEWCGEAAGGCANATTGCDFETCVGDETFEANGTAGVAFSTPDVCYVTSANASSLEMATYFDAEYATLLGYVCFTLDVVSNSNTTSELDSYTLDYDIVVYDADVSDAANPVPTETELFSVSRVKMPLSATAGVVQIAEDLSSLFWIITRPAFVGIRWTGSCPRLDLPIVTETTLSKRASSGTSVYRDPNNSTSTNWTTLTIVTPTVAQSSAGTCGDGFVARPSEECEPSGDLCTSNCTCWERAEPENYNGSCVCTGIQTLGGHSFVAPPTLSASFASATGVMMLHAELPQTIPARIDVAVDIVDSRTGDPINYSAWQGWDLSNMGCWFQTDINFSLPELVAHGKPVVIAGTDVYHIQWSLLMSWIENVTLSRSSDITVQRLMNSKLAFQVDVPRTLTTSVKIDVASSGVLWAYVRRSNLVLNDPSGLPPYFELDLETLVKEPNATIVEGTMKPVSWTSAFSNVTSATLVKNYTVQGDWQLWRFSIYLANDTLCKVGSSDGFTLQFTLVGDKLSAGTVQLAFTMLSLENWCSVNSTTVNLDGSQLTYADSYYGSSSLTTRFIRGMPIYVKASLSENTEGVEIALVEVESVAISGEIQGGSTTVAFNVEDCGTGKVLDACYSIIISAKGMTDYSVVTIETQLVATIVGGKRRMLSSSSPTLQGSKTASSIVMKTPEEVATGVTTFLIRYKVTPTMAAALATLVIVPSLSIAVALYVLRRRRFEETAVVM